MIIFFFLNGEMIIIIESYKKMKEQYLLKGVGGGDCVYHYYKLSIFNFVELGYCGRYTCTNIKKCTKKLLNKKLFCESHIEQ